MRRGKRYAVCGKTFDVYSRPPYRDQFILIEPATPVDAGEAPVWDCSCTVLRHPGETKGGLIRHTAGTPTGDASSAAGPCIPSPGGGKCC